MSDEKEQVVLPPGHSTNPSTSTMGDEKPEQPQARDSELESVSEGGKKDKKKNKKRSVRNASFHDYIVSIPCPKTLLRTRSNCLLCSVSSDMRRNGIS